MTWHIKTDGGIFLVFFLFLMGGWWHIKVSLLEAAILPFH